MAYLVVLSDSACESGVIGRLERHRNGMLRFRYDKEWRQKALAFPLSCSIPLTQDRHEQDRILPWLQGLITENSVQRHAWQARFGLEKDPMEDPQSLFAYLAQSGADLVGAVRFIPPRRMRSHLGLVAPEKTARYRTAISKSDLQKRLKKLLSAPDTARLAEDKGYFSLAGSQPKTALYHDAQGWAIPSGPVATTHILKLPSMPCEGLAENGHLCHSLARLAGLEAAETDVIALKGRSKTKALIVKRYDRLKSDKGIIRLHQEDLVQAMGLPPYARYEENGGPSAVALYHFIQASCDNPTDGQSFLQGLAFHWLIGNIDNHARNHALLLCHGHQTLFAPLYDLISIAPCKDIKKARLSLHIGGKIKVGKINRRQWRELAERIGMQKDQMDHLVGHLIEAVFIALESDAFHREVTRMDHPVAEKLRDNLRSHVKVRRKEFR